MALILPKRLPDKILTFLSLQKTVDLTGNRLFILPSGENMDDYLQYIGGTAGAVTLSAVAAATAYYYATRPSPDTPLVPLDDQSPILDVS